MTTQVPQSIEWSDVRVGDVIRAERDAAGVHVTYEGPVMQISNDRVVLGTDIQDPWQVLTRHHALTLISRPAPERPPGSLWWHEGTESAWVATDEDDTPYRLFKGGPIRPYLTTNYPEDVQFIAALIPYLPEPAQPGPVLCKWCDKPIEPYSPLTSYWQHVGSESLTCGHYSSATATPKTTP